MESNINLPSGWSDIKLWQYQDLIQYDESTNLSIISKYIGYIDIISDIEYSDIEDMDVMEVNDIIRNLQWLKTSPSNQLKSEINGYKLIDINKISIGEYIDICNFKKDLIKNLHILCSILYRKYKYGDFDNVILEDYSNIDIFSRSEIFLDLSINDIYPIIKYINDFDSYILNIYSNLFYVEEPEENLDPEDESELTPKEIIDLKKEKEKENWRWEYLIDNLSSGDITKYNEILKLPLILVFNKLSYNKLFES